MTAARLAKIYKTIRGLEWRRRNIKSRLQMERERAAGLYSFNGDTVKVKSSKIFLAPQERNFDIIDHYLTILSAIEEREKELAKTYFYDVQTLIEYSHAKAIYNYITGISLRPYCMEKAVKEMSAALNSAARRIVWSVSSHPLFFDNKKERKVLSDSIIKRAENFAVRLSLSWAEKQTTRAIIEKIRLKCKSRRITKEFEPENAILYAEICALEKNFVYDHQKELTEKELNCIECYMTDDDANADDEQANFQTLFDRAIEKLEAARRRKT